MVQEDPERADQVGPVLLMTGIVAGLGVLAYLPGRAQLRAAEDRLGEDPDAVHWDKPGSETSAPL